MVLEDEILSLSFWCGLGLLVLVLVVENVEPVWLVDGPKVLVEDMLIDRMLMYWKCSPEE